MKKTFLLFDGRAKTQSTDKAVVFDTADTEEEARRSGENEWKEYDAIWVEYDLSMTGRLVNGRKRFDLPPNV